MRLDVELGTKSSAATSAARPPVLLADATWYGTLAAARDLGAHGVPVTLACDAWIAPARWSRHVTRSVACPSPSEPAAFVQFLLDFGRQYPGHVLYPTSDAVAWLVAAHAEQLSRHYLLYSPRIEALMQLLDKAKLFDAARQAGLDVPETRVPTDPEAVERCGRELGFPLYIKPRAQVLGRGLDKGARVSAAADLLPAWQAQRGRVAYDPEVLVRIPDLALPVIQASANGADRIYTLDGFIDETGSVYAPMACVKLLQRPRNSGPGIVFEHAELDPAATEGLRRLFRAVGFSGVFDAEFIEFHGRKLLIDVNPRFYNHMAFEVERGLHLPWLAYLAATRDHAALRIAACEARLAPHAPRAYVHRLPTALVLGMPSLTSRASRDERRRWRRWIESHSGRITDPVQTEDDPKPARAELAMELVSFALHPRSFLRKLGFGGS